MSASHELKNEIITQQYKSMCCRRSLLSGVIFARSVVSEKEVIISLEKQEYAEFVASLIREFYNKEARIFHSKEGGRRVLLSFDSASASKYATFLNNLQPNHTVCDIITQKCSSCLPSFLRGVFLASGRLSNPKKQFSLEFTLGERTDAFAKILTDLSLTPRVSIRKSGDMVYFRNSYEIEDFFGRAAMNQAVFDITHY